MIVEKGFVDFLIVGGSLLVLAAILVAMWCAFDWVRLRLVQARLWRESIRRTAREIDEAWDEKPEQE